VVPRYIVKVHVTEVISAILCTISAKKYRYAVLIALFELVLAILWSIVYRPST